MPDFFFRPSLTLPAILVAALQRGSRRWAHVASAPLLPDYLRGGDLRIEKVRLCFALFFFFLFFCLSHHLGNGQANIVTFIFFLPFRLSFIIQMYTRCRPGQTRSEGSHKVIRISMLSERLVSRENPRIFFLVNFSYFPSQFKKFFCSLSFFS